MTIRQLIANNYAYQDTYADRTTALCYRDEWRRKGYAAEVVYMPLRGNYQLWVR